ncbi:MAG: hypothetical protein KAX37_02340, partial [Opitutaceae bacterium]|nr:hypothetical protein [Opitutaceae bacterium]
MKKTLLRTSFCIAAGMLSSFAIARSYRVDPVVGNMNNPGTASETWSTWLAAFDERSRSRRETFELTRLSKGNAIRSG